MYKARNLVLSICGLLLISCDDEWSLKLIPNQIQFHERLSDYGIFKGDIEDLAAAEQVISYQLNTPLFTDYAAKSRHAKIPKGKFASLNSNSEIEFPNGSILSKTFFYEADQLPEINKRVIIETRLLIKENGYWNVGVYQWNEEQTEAYLLESSAEVEFLQQLPDGNRLSTKYKIPSQKECTSCHNKQGSIAPIGPIAQNLLRKEDKHFNESFQGRIEPSSLASFAERNIPQMPRWNDSEEEIPLRARAYLSVNCSHCHNPKGIASGWNLDLRFNQPLDKGGIINRKHQIVARMESTWTDEKMPKIGTSLKHREGIQLIREYVENL